MKKINTQDKDTNNSKKASGYLPLSELDLKVLIREVPNSHPQFDEIEEISNYFSNYSDYHDLI